MTALTYSVWQKQGYLTSEVGHTDAVMQLPSCSWDILSGESLPCKGLMTPRLARDEVAQGTREATRTHVSLQLQPQLQAAAGTRHVWGKIPAPRHRGPLSL